MTAPRRSCATARSLRPPRKSASTRKKHDAAFPRTRHSLLPRRGRRRSQTRSISIAFYDKPFLKFERLLETYLALCAARLPLVPDGDAGLAEGEALSEVAACERISGIGEVPTSTRRYGCCFTEHHLSHAASAFFPSPFERSRDSDHGRRRRMGDDQSGDRQGQRDLDSTRRFTFRIRSACSTRPSPITPASRSIPASTR